MSPDRSNRGDAAPRTELYPDVQPHASGMLRLDGVHAMYWEECGNPEGEPVLFLHGGPGAGCTGTHRRFFDPKHYRIVLFDQRGAGRSTPQGELADNTTWHLVEDIERLRRHLGIERWLVFGGSWGSTLALVYGIAYPEHCTGFVLRGVFLATRAELDWFLYGMKTVFPENWRTFAEHLPEEERGELLVNYHRRLVDPDPAVHLPAARIWSGYEGACSTLLPSPETVASFRSDRVALGLARIEAHYFASDLFVEDGYILDNIGVLAGHPGVIVQGRYDMVCPPVTADALARAWPGIEYTVVPDAGHSAMEPGIRKALVAATERFKRRA